jgi:hypothetical protein
MPTPWPDITSAASWCARMAEELPHRQLAAESLVWKLASLVAVASSGTAPYEDHTFRTDELPALFEQILRQLQDFPPPLQHYRPQEDEPDLVSDVHARIVCGFSGAGKTSWAAQAAAHSASNCAYFDAGDTPGAALASALVRECAAQLAGTDPLKLESVLAPGASGFDSLRALDQILRGTGRAATAVIDNAHAIDADTLRKIIDATSHIAVVLLAHPVANITQLEALTGLEREELKGWSLDNIAAEASSLGSRGSIEALQQLRSLTGGYPLFVQSAARLATAQFGGDLAELCRSIESGTHSTATAQEVILAKTFEGMQAAARQALSIVSFSDVPLLRTEAVRLLGECMRIEEAQAAALLRQLAVLGLLQATSAERVRVHDTIRMLGKLHVKGLADGTEKRILESLKDIMLASLHERRDTSRFGFFARLLAALNHLEPLIELMGEELFHEMGITREVDYALEQALSAGVLTPDQQFWAYDGLIFSTLKRGGDKADLQKVGAWLRSMEQLQDREEISNSQKAALWLKRMHYEAAIGSADGVMMALERAAAVLPEDQTHRLIYQYNAATALHSLREYERAQNLVEGVIAEYYELLGLTPEEVIGRKQPELFEMLGGREMKVDHVKHLADALDLLAMVGEKKGNVTPMARIHAMRFYQVSGALDSFVRVGIDLADQLTRGNDFEGARQVMDDFVLPAIRQHGLMARAIEARGLYAVIIAYCGDQAGAQREIERLILMAAGASPEMRLQIERQRALISKIAVDGPPPQRRIGPMTIARPIAAPSRNGKVGRNDPCPCGSGLKYKKCHGA